MTTSTPSPDATLTSFTPKPADGPLTIGQQFGSRYRILKVLGAGGMGVVYQAWDQALDLPVALKVIRPEVLADATVAREVEGRFKRELVLARQVTHRNVVRIHDLGEIDGIKYISMPFIEGKSLAAILAESGRLPCAGAIQIIRQIADGLKAAHDAGVIHRDLKPENVMVDADGRAIIMDFGISRSAAGATTIGLTVAGSVVGTVQYMAPEQAMGQPVDQRADVYALGLIAYDLIAGCQRFANVTTPVSEMMQRVQHAPAPLRARVPDAPPEIERILARALEPDPAKRYQTVAEFIADLDAFTNGGKRGRFSGLTRVPVAGLAIATIVIVAAIGGASWWLARGRAPAAVVAHDPVSVVIADFENKANDPLFDGAVEQALGIGIEGASFISAYARGDAQRAVQQFAPGQRLDLERARLLARREGIKIVLAGTIGPSGQGYAISVRAIDPVTGTEVANVSGDAANKAEVLKAISEVATDLRFELGDHGATGEPAGLETFTASSLEAASEYSRAQDLAAAEKHDLAVAHYRRATELDGDFGRAYSGWALSAQKLGRNDEARALFAKALSLLGRMTEREKFRTLGLYYSRVDRNYDKAIENYEQLVQKYPSDGAGWNNLAIAYFRTLDFPKAFEAGRKALAIFPKKILYRNNYALYAMYAGDFKAAADEARAVALESPSVYAYLPLAMSALGNGDSASARAAYGDMAKAGQLGESLSVMGLADVALYEGNFSDAERILAAGIATDEAKQNAAGAAAKQIALAEALAAERKTADALRALAAATKLASDDATRVSAARLYLQLGKVNDAAAIATDLAKKIQPQSRAYAHIINGEIAASKNDAAAAADELQKGRALADLWLGRVASGVNYVKAASYPAALSDLEAALKRRGEATAVFLDDVPSFRYIVPVYYWMGRAQDGTGLKKEAAENYAKYLALRRSATDSLAADAERRLAALR